MSHHSHKHRSHERDDGEDTRKRALESKREKETGGKFTPPTGKTTFRILHTPADDERNSPADFMEVQVHDNIGPSNKSARCGNEPGQGQDPKNCWLCRKMDKLKQKGKTKQASQLFPGRKLLVQVCVMDKDLDTMVGPLLWSSNSGKTPKALGFKLLNILSSPNSNKWLNHEKGYNFVLTRTGEGKNTVWDVERDEEKTAVPRQILKRLQSFADLTSVFHYDEDYQKRTYYGLENQEGDNDMAKTKKKKHASDDDASASASASSSDASSSDASSSDASASASGSSSDASSSDASSSSSDDNSKKKSKKKTKKDSSSSDASSSDASSSSSDASSSDASSSDASSSSSDASSSDKDSSSSDASSSSSDASSSDKAAKTKRKPRSDKGTKRKPAKKAKKRK